MKSFMYLGICFGIIVLLSLNCVSAWNWDNTHKYNDTERAVTITNALGMGADIAKIKLITPHIYNVTNGTNIKVAELEFDNYEDYLDVFNDMKFYDVNDKNKEVTKEFSYKIVGGDKIDTKLGLKKGKVRVEIYTDVEVGDKVEWIPTFYGVEISEWALYEYQLSGDGGGGTINAGISYGQTFTIGIVGANESIYLTNISVDVRMHNVADPIIKIGVRNVNSTNDITGSDIASGTVHVPNDFVFRWINVSMATPLLIEKGGMRGFYVQAQAGDGEWLRQASGTYDGGMLEVSDAGNGVLWRKTTLDSTFQIFGEGNPTIPSLFVTTNLISPNNTEYSYINSLVDFISNSSTLVENNFTGNFTNATLTVWNSTNAIYKTNYTTLSGEENSTDLSLSIPVLGDYKWNVEYCAVNLTSTICSISNNNMTFYVWGNINITLIDPPVNDNSIASTKFFTSDYNITTNGSWINTTLYIWKADGTLFKTNSTTITGINNRTNLSISGFLDEGYNWNYYACATNISSLTCVWAYANRSLLNNFYFGLCNSTMNVPYYNFTFKEEGTNSILNGQLNSLSWTYWNTDQTVNKSFTFSSTVENMNYTLCGTPSYFTFNNLYSVSFSSAGYPQRTISQSTALALTNSTTQKVLYLLNSSQGLYSTYITQSLTGVLSNVYVLVQKSGTTIVEGYTDDSGSITFWLDYNSDHVFTFTKSGYLTVQKTIKPSSSSYTVVMESSGGSNVSYNNSLEGMRWIITPATGRLEPSTTYTFGFNITASKNNIVNCKMEIVNETTILNSTTTLCNGAGGNLSLSLNTGTRNRLWGKYYVDIGDGYFLIEGDSYWFLIPGNETGLTIKDFFIRLKNLDTGYFGTGCGTGILGSHACRAEFSRILFFFIFLFLILGYISYATSWDLPSQGGLIMVLFPIVLFASIAGWLRIDMLLTPDWIDNYIVAIIALFFSAGWILNNWSVGK